METVLIVVKLSDNVFVKPQNAQKVFLGKDYFKAQKKYFDSKSIRTDLKSTGSAYESTAITPTLTPDVEGFQLFTESFDILFPDTKLYALYCLADKVSYIKNTKIEDNILNYFAFFHEINPEYNGLGFTNDSANLMMQAPPTAIQRLIEIDSVQHWWFEGEMNVKIDQRALGCDNMNSYYQELGFSAFTSRGKNVTIYDAEDVVTTQIRHQYLKNINQTAQFLPNPDADALHFYNTLGIIFSKPPNISSKQILGIAPEATLGVLEFQESTEFRVSLNEHELDKANNFIQRAVYVDLLKKQGRRKNLIGNGNILLLERQVNIAMGNNVFQNFPLETLPDMRNAFRNCEFNKIIVVQPAGQNVFSQNIIPNLDSAINSLILKMGKKFQYYNFNDKSCTIFVGAIDKNHIILGHDTNFSNVYITNKASFVDAYLWGECIETLGVPNGINANNDFAEYGYTSAATAIMAGIVAALQSEAKKQRRFLETRHLKAVFERTFRENGTIFKPNTIKQLWKECEIELSRNI